MKKVLLGIGLFLLFGYLFFSVFYFKDKSKDGSCENFIVVLKSHNDGKSFIDTSDIVKNINNKGLNPTGKLIKDINTSDIEQLILENHLIKDAQAYVTDNGTVKVNIVERIPVLRIVPNQGESYYVDQDGNRMSLSRYYTAHVPLVSGMVKEDLAKADLYKFALFLSKDKFWNAQIEQIIVSGNQEISLIPRVGDHRIVLGKLDNYEDKLEKLLLFYKEGLNNIGWNKYSVINLKFDKQVVCTRR